MKTISVIGSGYVGVTTAAIVANCGYKVHLIDINPERIEVLKNGKSFFYEQGIDSLLLSGINSGNLLPSTEYSPGIEESEVVFSCVGTPDNPDGSSNLEFVYKAAKTASELMKPNTVYVQKSTVPVGTGRKVMELLPESSSYVSNPEFLREGSAVFDTLFFDRIVVGSDDSKSANAILEIYKSIEDKRDKILKITDIISTPHQNQGKYISTTLESAELIKVTANAFLALKISFANSIAKLADQSNADVVEVMDGIGADNRIGRAFLNAGRGYGGGCFPKDVSGLIESASGYGVEMPILTASQHINESMPGYIVNKAKVKVGDFKNKKVTVLGLAFKAGTSDARRSPGVKIANLLANEGALVTVYDPYAVAEAKHELYKEIDIAENTTQAINSSEVIFIATDWPEFNNLGLLKKISDLNNHLLVDCMNCFDKNTINSLAIRYLGVGR